MPLSCNLLPFYAIAVSLPLVWAWRNSKITTKNSTKICGDRLEYLEQLLLLPLIPILHGFWIKIQISPRFEFGEAGHLSHFCIPLQIHRCTKLDKEFTKLIYELRSWIWLTSIAKFPVLTKILNFKNGSSLRKSGVLLSGNWCYLALFWPPKQILP